MSLVAWGIFEYAGDSASRKLSLWNGTNWSPVFEIGENESVTAFTVFNNRLIVATLTDEPIGPDTFRVLAWDGSSLEILGATFNGRVRSFAAFNNELIAVGNFTLASDDCVARWNGTHWIGFPLVPFTPSQNVNTACEWNNTLVIGGDASNQNAIFAWNGSTWSPVGSPSLERVITLVVFNGELIAGGTGLFQGAGPKYAVARWSGSNWSPMGGEFRMFDDEPGTVLDLKPHNGELYASGNYASIDGIACGSIAKWDGTHWQPIDVGISEGFTGTWARSLATFQGTLIVAGNFTRAGSIRAANIASWNGSSWSTLGTGVSSVINASVAHNGSVVVGGPFDEIQGELMHAVARWDGSAWHAMPGLDGEVYALAVYNSEVIAAGEIFLEGQEDPISVARWNGAQWIPIGTTLFGTVRALIVYNGELIAGGDIPGSPRNNLARWNGTLWRSLGSGVNNRVSSLAVYAGSLYVGGRFSAASGVPARGIARWNGTTWQAVGAGVTSPNSGYNVTALAVHDGQLVASAGFASISSLPLVLCAWDGATWQTLGGLFGECYGLFPYQSDLVAIGPGYEGGIARWDGIQWSLLSTGLTDAQPALQSIYGNSAPYTAVEFNGELFVGGNFQAAGNQPSAYWARWRDFTPTAIDQQPNIVVTCADQPAQFGLLASGSEVLTYQWQWLPTPSGGGTGAWLNIEEGNNERPSSNSVAFIASGSGTPSLTLQDTRLDTVAADGIRCLVSTSCDSVTSGTASLTVCFANLNCDAGVDIDDLLMFLDAFGAGTLAADLDDSSGLGAPDGNVDINDLLFFLARFEAGC